MSDTNTVFAITCPLKNFSDGSVRSRLHMRNALFSDTSHAPLHGIERPLLQAGRHAFSHGRHAGLCMDRPAASGDIGDRRLAFIGAFPIFQKVHMHHAQARHTPPQRRRFIQLAGGGAVLAALPLAACSTGYPAASVSAWQPPGETPDVRHWMLAHGLLAPNPHNRQPWIADLRRDGEITLVCDGERLLPETDPFGRQILIGCGAFIELAVMAAAERGHSVRVQLFPDGEPGPRELPGGRSVARLSLTRDAATPKDPLFAQIRRRHTHRGAFDNARVVPADVWRGMTASATDRSLLAGAVVSPATMASMRSLTRDAFEAEMTTPRTYLESARLMRIGPVEIERHRDGIALMGTMVRVLAASRLFDRFEVPARGGAGYKQTMAHWSAAETGSGYLWIASRGNARAAQVNSGRAYVRAHLQATAAGVDMQPLSQALQEFAEVRPQHDALRALLGFGNDDITLQMLARVGYGMVGADAAPRRELGQLMRT